MTENKLSVYQYHNNEKENYDKEVFKNHAIDHISKECPLCHKIHPPKYHTSVSRTYKISFEEKEIILVSFLKIYL